MVQMEHYGIRGVVLNWFKWNIMVNNTKKTWEGIRKIANIKKSSKPSQLNVNGKIIDDDKKLATNFNNFFVNVGQNTENAIPKVPNMFKKPYSNEYYSSYC